MSSILRGVLARSQVTPVLVDVGASGSSPEIWDGIAASSIYLGFDPDRRELADAPSQIFRRSIVVNLAIAKDASDGAVPIYLTRSPFCSSTLEPDMVSLQDYLFSHLFTVEGTTSVQATTLGHILNQYSLSHIDWLKLDTQGTDLRILLSLDDATRSQLLAVDLEPGLVDAYVGEDLFVDAHACLANEGFWLSRMEVHGSVRMSNATLEKFAASGRLSSRAAVERAIRPTPVWCEVRYLRTLDWMIQRVPARQSWLLLWIFALLDGQLGFSLDLALAYERQHGTDRCSTLLVNETLSLLRRQRYVGRVVAGMRYANQLLYRTNRIARRFLVRTRRRL